MSTQTYLEHQKASVEGFIDNEIDRGVALLTKLKTTQTTVDEKKADQAAFEANMFSTEIAERYENNIKEGTLDNEGFSAEIEALKKNKKEVAAAGVEKPTFLGSLGKVLMQIISSPMTLILAGAKSWWDGQGIMAGIKGAVTGPLYEGIKDIFISMGDTAPWMKAFKNNWLDGPLSGNGIGKKTSEEAAEELALQAAAKALAGGDEQRAAEITGRFVSGVSDFKSKYTEFVSNKTIDANEAIGLGLSLPAGVEVWTPEATDKDVGAVIYAHKPEADGTRKFHVAYTGENGTVVKQVTGPYEQKDAATIVAEAKKPEASTVQSDGADVNADDFLTAIQILSGAPAKPTQQAVAPAGR